MPSDKRNSITAKAIGLISSLFNVASSRDVPYSGKKRYFSCSPLSIALRNEASKREFKAYWHMKFSLINGCGTRKKIFVLILSFEVALVNSPNIIIVTTKKVNRQVYGKIQSIGIIAIKSSETSSVTYTCRYSSGHF